MSVRDRTGAGPVCIVCEHAAEAIPEHLGDLGLTPEHRHSHAVWDIGAADLAGVMADRLNAALVTACLSRLVIDLNRPPEAPDAMPARVEIIDVPGNRDLDTEERQARATAVYYPFHAAVSAALDRRSAPVLVTVHSFTPVWHGERRAAEIGLLHDADPSLAQAMLDSAPDRYRVELNVPYSARDGVTHTLVKHGTARGIPNVMIEVRNDLLSDEDAIMRVADTLCTMLTPVMERME